MTLQLADACRILGERGHLIESQSSSSAEKKICKLGFKADAVDPVSGKTGAVYFLLEEFADSVAAREKYRSIKKANQGHAGVRTLNDLGTEAYFHSDGDNFYFVMVRKGTRVFNMK